MNKHIEIVKKWLKDKDSVSAEELEANKKSAYAAYYADAADAAFNVYEAACYAADAADAAFNVYEAACYADAAADAAEYWVRQYEELTNELL
jgi:hypothetical protein